MNTSNQKCPNRSSVCLEYRAKIWDRAGELCEDPSIGKRISDLMKNISSYTNNTITDMSVTDAEDINCELLEDPKYRSLTFKLARLMIKNDPESRKLLEQRRSAIS